MIDSLKEYVSEILSVLMFVWGGIIAVIAMMVRGYWNHEERIVSVCSRAARIEERHIECMADRKALEQDLLKDVARLSERVSVLEGRMKNE